MPYDLKEIKQDFRRARAERFRGLKPKAKGPLTVFVHVEGGVVQDVRVPKGVRVVVKDYDDESETEPYLESVWVNESDEVKQSGRG